jgi:RNA polymerase sigma factor (TIGR02999 family)
MFAGDELLPTGTFLIRSMAGTESATQLLLDARTGRREAVDSLFVHLYDELRAIAHQRLRRQRPGETLNTTALVHEAYLRLIDQTRVGSADRAHFLALASRAMRFALIDYARSRTAQKRGGAGVDLPLDAVHLVADERAADLMVLNEALEQLTRASERLGRLVEYRFFGGLSYEEIAEITGQSVPTLKRDWTRARAWLYRAMQAVEG